MRYFNLNKGTEPLLIHFNNDKNKIVYQESFFNCITKSDIVIEKPDDLTILTFAFGSEEIEFPLIKQLKKNGIEFINLCNFIDIDKWSMTLKISMLYDYLNSDNIKTKYVLVLDASDVVIGDNFNKITDKFKKTNKKILYGAGQNRYPNIQILNEKIEYNRSPNRYLNAGTVIGEVEYLKDFISKAKNNISDNRNIWNSEQYVIRKTLLEYENKEKIDYDSNCLIFQTMDKTKYEIINGHMEIRTN